MSPAEKQQRLKIIVAFGLVYVFWGSTYLAMRIAVMDIPALFMTGMRYLIAGPLMLAWCALSGRRIGINKRDFLRVLLIGVLLLTIANVIVAWSEEVLPSGLASLIVAIVPLWVAVVEGPVLKLDRLNRRAWSGLVLGVLGLGVLLWPQISASTSLSRKELFISIVLIFGALSWSCGSLASRHFNLSIGPLAATGWEMSIAGCINMLLALAIGDQHHVVWSVRGVGAVAYLIIFGSWVGFTAYIWLLNHVPAPKVATYAYVNPVVAVFLGWLILHERVDAFIIAGTVVIVAAVALVTSSKTKRESETSAPQLPACEVGAD
jgi:drug/metabolite transporter (DMT)-like permease